MTFKKGAKVSWKWVGRVIEGAVEDVFIEKVTRKIKTASITRNGTKENPAYLVKSDAGNLALKLGSELTPVKKSKAAKPSMFG